MTAVNANTFDLVPPRRPGIDDVGSALAKNKNNITPSDPTYPSAEMLNTLQRLAVAFGTVLPHTLLTIDETLGGGPAVVLAASCATAANGQVAPGAPFTIIRHVGGDAHGDIDVTWPAGTFPAAVADAYLKGVTSDTAITEQRCIAITNGVRIRTKASGTGTDCRLVLAIC